MVKKVFICLLLTSVIVSQLPAQTTREQWVDSTFNTMDLDQKIGQLFMVPVYPKTDKNHIDKIEDAIKSHHVGGVIFIDGGPIQLAGLNNHIQQISSIPLLTGVDATAGLGTSIDSTVIFPPSLMLGALRNEGSVYGLGAEIARQMNVLGLHINFAPSVDRASTNSPDKIMQSFGDNTTHIATRAVAYMKGLQDNGIIACTSHFPIHGLTVVDIKKDGLPELKAYIDSNEIYPYKKLFENNIKGVLPASSEFPLFYEKKKNIKKNKFTPALLTSIYAGDWLKKEMNYSGLVFVSIPDIKDRAGAYKGGEAELLSFQAGNDIILFPEDIGPAVRKIKRLFRKETTYEAQLDNTVRKILAFKYDAGLHKINSIETNYLYERLNSTEINLYHQRLLEGTVTIVRDDHKTVPIQSLENRKIATLSLGNATPNAFSTHASRYTDMQHFSSGDLTEEEIIAQLQPYNTILVGLFSDPATHASLLSKLSDMQENREIVLCFFGSPVYLKDLDKFNTVIEAYMNDETMHKIVAQAVFGALQVNGVLPVTISPAMKEGQGFQTPSLKRLTYSIPEDAGMDRRVLQKIESIAREAIEIKATPGCHVLVAKDGKVVYEQSFGYLTYDSIIPVSPETIYDLASLTKVSATLQTVMFMHDRGLIDVNRKASYYLPELRNSNKKDYTLKDILTHQAGLWPFLPFWAQTMKDTLFLPEFYHPSFSPEYPFLVADNLYASRSMKDSLWAWIVRAKVRDKVARTPHDYRYSDMGFYILMRLAEKILNQPMEDFLQQNLYEPLGATSTGYLPLTRFPRNMIAPTEKDKLFRKKLLIGTVHDQGAAMHGGVAGHAGLFSNANDLAKLGQMLLQEGFYGGIQYYKPETVRAFIDKQYESSRRGLGWDKPVQSDWNSPTSIYASGRTFGHTGFTGTCMWIDPEFNLVYVFLSNRVHPEMTNNKLLSASIRSRIQDVIYESIFRYCGREAPIKSSETALSATR